MENLKSIVDNVSETLEKDVRSSVQNEGKQEGLNPQQWLAMSRRERRTFLKKHSKYFEQKKQAPLNIYLQVIKSNIEFGNMKSKVVTENDIKVNTEILENREKSYRSEMAFVGYSQELIDKKVDLWYAKVIKDGSFMIEK